MAIPKRNHNAMLRLLEQDHTICSRHFIWKAGLGLPQGPNKNGICEQWYQVAMWPDLSMMSLALSYSRSHKARPTQHQFFISWKRFMWAWAGSLICKQAAWANNLNPHLIYPCCTEVSDPKVIPIARPERSGKGSLISTNGGREKSELDIWMNHVGVSAWAENGLLFLCSSIRSDPEKRAMGRTLPNYLDFGRCLLPPILWKDTWPKINEFIDLGNLYGTVWFDKSPERRKIGSSSRWTSRNGCKIWRF